ncbi:hypothetical protein WJX72_009266 [[Myrmecia] bisecta]|uniref:VTT domain-containing protein n=1 Tax=[Myrmecia] bisecta TaxID=41462 RepID=A0AAW1QG25_9CHLO
MPSLTAPEIAVLKKFPPRALPDLIAQRDVLLSYAAKYPVVVLVGFCSFYILMQTFAIPGTISLSLLAGAIYGAKHGLALVSVISTVGSSVCYCMSWLLGKSLVHAIWPEQLKSFAAEVKKRQNELLNYMIFLRVTPILPNTFINVASPIVGLPLQYFALGTFLGCLPNNFIAVTAGGRLGELKSLSDLYDAKMAVLGLAVGTIALVPIFYKRKHEYNLKAKSA